MSQNWEVSVRVEIKPTAAAASDQVQCQGGEFSLVLESERTFDISALERGLLNTAQPALRAVLAEHLEREVKKMPGTAAS
jgi:hypothetical protein